MAKYKVHSYFKMYEEGEIVVDDSTMSTCADLDAAKRVFLGKVDQLAERTCAAYTYTCLMCGAYVEDEDETRPLTFYIDMDGEDEQA